MAILNLIRIDERLIHGQIVTSWVAKSRANTIVIADDEVYQDELQCDLLSMVTPPDIELKIKSVADAAAYINSPENSHVLLLVKTPGVVNSLIDHGVKLDDINVGNMGSKSNRTKYATTLW
ncbi:PTS system mannose/fructose/N-acetylgalactosamine-transporter subunit IIB, partial [Klebsiella pneumoniae]